MADDSMQIQALTDTFRQMLAADELSLATVKTYRAAALTAILARTEVISLTMEGGSSSAVMTCHPAIVLEACKTVIAEEDAELVGTGVTHLNLSGNRIES